MLSIDPPLISAQKEFDYLLTQMIDDNLLQVLGSSMTDARNGWSKEDVPNRVEEFIASLHGLHGIGATSLEWLLLKCSAPI